jgi:hypothetical protein
MINLKRNVLPLAILSISALIAGLILFYESPEECFYKEATRSITKAQEASSLPRGEGQALWDNTDPVQFTAVAKDIVKYDTYGRQHGSQVRYALIAAFARCRIDYNK